MADTVWVGTTNSTFATGTNYLGGSAPITGDSLTYDGRAIAVVTGATTGITVTALTQYTSMAYAVATSALMLNIGATVCLLGVPTNDGSSKTPAEIALNFGAVQTACTVYSSASSGTNSLPPVLLKGSHISNKLTVIGGTVGVAAEVPGSTAVFATVNIVGPGARVFLESGCTLTTINQDDGFFHLRAAAITITQKGGTFQVTGSGAITTINCNGTMEHQGTGTITTLNVQDGGTADFGETFDAITVTNCTVYGSGKINDPNKRVTWTNGIILSQGANASQVNIIAPVTLTIV